MKIALIAPFKSFSDTYSLSHVVLGQFNALRDLGHEVEVWSIKSDEPSTGLAERFGESIRPIFSRFPLEHDKVCGARVEQYSKELIDAIDRFKPEAIITHDVILQTSYIDFAATVHDIAKSTSEIRWFHYLHSGVAHPPPTIRGDQRFRRTVPKGHTVIFPNKVNIANVAEYYGIDESRVKTCQNPRDPSELFKLCELSRRIVGLTNPTDKDFVQVYPFCATRLEHKGVRQLVRIFDALKSMGKSVLLILVPANANGPKEKEALSTLLDGCTSLTKDDVYVTSLEMPAWETGLPNKAVCSLQRFANVFVFPTLAEACPLAMAEAMANAQIIAFNVHAPGVSEYAPLGSIRFGLPAMNQIDSFSATVEETVSDGLGAISTITKKYTGREAFDFVVTQTAKTIVSVSDSCPAFQSRLMAFKTFSNKAVGKKLESIIK